MQKKNKKKKRAQCIFCFVVVILSRSTLRKGDENMLLDGEGARVEGELKGAEDGDIPSREGAGHKVAEPIGNDLDKEY